MLFRQLTIASLFTALAVAGTGSADACCLTDWLYGRQASPYAAGYAPVGTIAPVGFAQPYAAGYTPISTSSTTLLPAQTPALSSGAYQAQRPAYLDNPSVYTGLPVGNNLQTSYSVPLTSAPQLSAGNQSLFGGLRGNASARPFLGSSQYGASNVYPNSSYYQSNYASAQVGLPATALPATNVAPLFPRAPATPVRSGLSRFFGSLFGTNYQSSYYRAPITYYRPVTSVDPTLGTTVTVQQPCTSTVQQLQRTPYNSFQLSAPAPMQAAPGFGSPTCSTPAFGQAGPAYQPSAYQPSAIGQASAIAPAAGQFTVPIPSTATPPSGFGQSGLGQSSFGQGQPNTAPLTGSPSSPRSQSDLSPVDPPSLNNYQQPSYQQRSETSFRDESPSYDQPAPRSEPTEEPSTQKSYWELQSGEDSTAMISPSKRYGAVRPDFESRQAPAFTGIRPIRALDEDEPSPFRQELSRPSTSPSYDTPQLPARTAPVGGYTTSSRVPVREAAMTRRSYRRSYPAAKPLAPAKRDNTWSTAK
ncbi:hypothetical protein LF1_50840 [Rubripirellula obstinata]|uniref:Uncharacterized protein n=1 Tax=Rubripirellula obstinata TaxID=406547 RepID=A0A5B1CRL7_9BACT|nr:hypothetical protein [Rubripirellula obstinata]KAA1262519.1 hypothetical protein LF1_50840 [Rubripirellula obstinata]